jgi:hypothetical protein
MQCPDPVDLTRAHRSGDDALYAHVATCERCGDEWRELDLLAGLGRDLAWQRPAREQVDAMRAQVVASVAPRAVRRRAPRVVGFGVALAAAAAAVVWVASGGEEEPAATYAAAVRPLPRAHYELVTPGPDEQVRVWDGSVAVEVETLRVGERFRVITGDAEVEVRGTAFDVVVKEDRLVAVVVSHGRVEVRAQGAAPVMIGAGERWDAAVARPEPVAPVPPGIDEPAAAAAAAVPPPAVEETARVEEPARTGRRARREPAADSPPERDEPARVEPMPAADPVTPAVAADPPATEPARVPVAPVTPPTTAPVPAPDRPAAGIPTTATPPTTAPAPDRRQDQRDLDRRQDRRDDLRDQRRDDRRNDRRDERRRERRQDRR